MRLIFEKIIHLIKSFSWRNRLAIIFSQPLLILLLPRTYWRLWENVFKPTKFSQHVTGFSPHMTIILTWYLRVNYCVKKYGRRGFVYEDGLGLSLKERFWLNPLTLKIYNRLRIQKFTLMTAAIFSFNVLIIGALERIPPYQTAILLLLIGASSLFLASFFRLAKPESLSWALFPITIYAFIGGHYLTAISLCFLISILNFTTTLLTVESILLQGLISGNFISGILVIAIPSLKLIYDSLPFLRASLIKELLEAVGGRKAKSRHDKFLRLRPNDIYLSFFYLLCIAGFIASHAPINLLFFLISPLILFIINQNFFRFSDNNTFFRFFLVTATTALLLYHNTLTITGYLMLIYLSPLCLIEAIEDVLKNYPHLKTYSIQKLQRFLQHTFKNIPDQSRIAFERHDTEKSMQGFSAVLYFFEFFLTPRSIELLPMEWLRMTQLKYFMQEYVKLNGASSQKIVEQKLQELAANYLLIYSKRFASQLRKWGYSQIGQIKSRDLQAILWHSNRVAIPKKDLYLFQSPKKFYYIEPTTPLLVKPNLIVFQAHRPGQYLIKYNYHPSWQAHQDHKRIPIKPCSGKLSFLTLNIKKAGQVILRFNTNYWSR